MLPRRELTEENELAYHQLKAYIPRSVMETKINFPKSTLSQHSSFNVRDQVSYETGGKNHIILCILRSPEGFLLKLSV
jgi:hypothetical protein